MKSLDVSCKKKEMRKKPELAGHIPQAQAQIPKRRLAMRKGSTKNFVELLEQAGIPFRYYVFNGACLPEKSKGFPEKVGEYDTVNHGLLEEFKRGAERVLASDREWVLVREYLSWGDPCYPTIYRAVYVPQEHQKEAEEIRKSLGLRWRDEID